MLDFELRSSGLQYTSLGLDTYLVCWTGDTSGTVRLARFVDNNFQLRLQIDQVTFYGDAWNGCECSTDSTVTGC